MSTPPAARSEPTGSAASAELDGDNVISIDKICPEKVHDAAAPPPAPAKHARRPNSTSEGLTPEGRTRLDHLENELDRLIRTLTTDTSSSSSAGSDADSIADSSSSTSDYDIDNHHYETSNEQNEAESISDGVPSGEEEIATAAGNKSNLGGCTEEMPRPKFDLFSAGDDMMDAVEDLLDSTAPSSRSKMTSSVTSTTITTTSTTNDAVKFTLSGKKITYLTVTELHKEKRRLKRRLREMKNEANERKGTATKHGDHDDGSAEVYYGMYRAITERITILEWKELMEHSGESRGIVSEGSFAAACATGITQRGKQQSDLVRIVEEDDECEAGEDSGTNANTNANAFDDSIADSSSSTSDYDIDNHHYETSNEQNEAESISDGVPSGEEEIATAAGNKSNLGGCTEEMPRPKFDLFSAGDDMMDAVEDLLDSTAPSSRSKMTSSVTSTTITTTSTTNDAVKFTLSGKKITYLTVTELHKEKRRLKRRLREMKNEANERKGTATKHGDHDDGSAEVYYGMYRAITERITILEWKELMEHSGESRGIVSEGSFAAACATGITQRGKQQSDLVRIVEEDDECEAGEDSGTNANTNANAFDDRDSDAGDAHSSKAKSISESDCSTADSDSDTSSDFDDDDDDVDGLFNFSDDLEHRNCGEHFSSELFSPFTSSTSPIKTAKPENTTKASSSVIGSDSPLRPRKFFDGSNGAARTTADASRDTGSSDGGMQGQGPTNTPPTDHLRHELVPVVILMMDDDRGTFDLLGVRIDCQKRRVQDLLDIVTSSKDMKDNKEASSPPTKPKKEQKIPVVSPLSCGSATRPPDDTCTAKDLIEDNDMISTSSSIWDPPMEINIDSNARVQYDGIIQCRDEDYDDESIVEGMLLINCLGLRRYSVVPREMLVAKPADMSVDEASEHADELLKKLLRVDMLSCDNTTLTLSSLASGRIVESHTLLLDEDRPPDAAILLFSPPFEVCTRKDSGHQKGPSSDADETGSTLITEDDAITHASGLLDIYPCSNAVDDEGPNSPNVLLKKNWETHLGDFYAVTTPSETPSGRQGLLAGTPGTVQLPASCKPRAGASKFSLKSLASIARGAKKQVNDAVIDAEKLNYLRGKTTKHGTKYSKVVEETDRELMREIVNATNRKMKKHPPLWHQMNMLQVIRREN